MTSAFFLSPLGYIRLGEDRGKLTSLSFSGGSIFETPKKNEVIEYTKNWLKSYFSGSKDPFDISLTDPAGTDFQKEIWRILLEIPYGSTVSYAHVARVYNERFDASASPRAVGGAVGKNPIAIVIPCHRVVCSDGSQGGFAYGPEIKRRLLELERS
ncbi:MAG: methylated-DNA--[Clostridia bacterium]|nr:methylated-DNA--[protein]-cysteine S-methyltransferase [Clostridia bacterium]